MGLNVKLTNEIRSALASQIYQDEEVLSVNILEIAMTLSSGDGGLVGTFAAAAGQGPMGIALTTNKILIAKGGGFFSRGFSVEAFPWHSIDDVAFDGNALAGCLIIREKDGDGLGITSSENATLKTVYRAIVEILDKINTVPPPPTRRPKDPNRFKSGNSEDVTDKLSKLAAMHHDGLLTDQEFADLKRRLLQS